MGPNGVLRRPATSLTRLTRSSLATMFMGNIFGPDLGIIVIILLVVVLGGSRLPKLARNVGTAGREFRKAQQEAEEEAEQAEREKAARAAAAALPAAAPPAAVPPAVTASTAPAPAAGDSVTLSRAELDALLTEREERARREASGPAS